MQEITVVIGRTKSGKTQLISQVLGPQHRRRITFDATGETESLYPAAYRAHGLGEAYSALQLWAERRMRYWHLVVIAQPVDVARLMSRLCPVYDGRRRALAEQLGGVCVEVSELARFAPVGGDGGEGIAEAWRVCASQGRHAKLSILAATQRPAMIARTVTSEADRVIAFQIGEPRDLQYLRELGGRALADGARSLARYHSLWYDRLNRTVTHKDELYRTVRVTSFDVLFGGGDVDVL